MFKGAELKSMIVNSTKLLFIVCRPIWLQKSVLQGVAWPVQGLKTGLNLQMATQNLAVKIIFKFIPQCTAVFQYRSIKQDCFHVFYLL